MKNKIVEVENDNFLLKYLKDNKNNKFIDICQLKKKKQIIFKLNLYFFSDKFESIELLFDLETNLIKLYSPINKEDNKLYIEENINQQYLKNFQYDLFYSSIPNNFNSFNLLNYNLQNNIKIKINNIIQLINDNNKQFYDIFKKFELIYNFLLNEQNFLKNLIDNKLKDINFINNILNELDNKINNCKNNMNNLLDLIKKIKYLSNFEYKNFNIHFLIKKNKYYLYKNIKDNILYEINYLTYFFHFYSESFEIYFNFENENNITFQIINKFIYILKNNFVYLGLISQEKVYFGLEKGKKYTYLGNYLNDKFNGEGILFNQNFIYKGKFKLGNKTDINCFIVLEPNFIFYKGGIENNELKEKGLYEIKNNLLIESNFKNGEINEDTKIIFKNGDIYEGKIQNSLKKGKWKYIQKEKNIIMNVDYDNIDGVIYKY